MEASTYPADDQVAEALRWIRDIFTETGAEYQVVGGLAARGYGATRPLVDLDFYVSARDLPRVLARVGDACVRGPEHFRDEHWDLTFAKLEKHGVRIELAEAEGARYYSPTVGRWLDQGIEFHNSEKLVVLEWNWRCRRTGSSGISGPWIDRSIDWTSQRSQVDFGGREAR